MSRSSLNLVLFLDQVDAVKMNGTALTCISQERLGDGRTRPRVLALVTDPPEAGL